MKKTLAAAVLAIALPAVASASDLNPGALQLSGKSSFEFESKSVKTGAVKETESSLGAELSAMYFVSHFLGFGLDVAYAKRDSGSLTRSDFLFGPKGGIDWELASHLSAFADLTVGIARSETNLAGVVDTGDGFGYRVGAGIRLFFNRNVSLDAFGAFQQVRVDFPTAGKETTSDFTAGLGLSVYLTNNPSNSEDYRPPPPPASGYDYPR